MSKADLNNAIVRIFEIVDGEPSQVVGAGFLVSPRHIITCAHVIVDALDISLETSEPPIETIYLDFPLLPEHEPLEATTLKWYPVKENYSVGEMGDICLLQLSTPLPQGAESISIVVHEQYFGRKVRMFGFPSNRGMYDGDWLVGQLQGLIRNGWVQLDSEIGRRSVAGGFSGTAVWDIQENAVAGMMVSIDDSDSDDTAAYMIPAKNLSKALPNLIKTVNHQYVNKKQELIPTSKTYIPDYKYDIFVSYAYCDNEPLYQSNKGWVTTLINTLKIKLRQKLGEEGEFSLWVDYEQGKPEIRLEEHLGKAATLIVILSTGYMESRRCQQEFKFFLEHKAAKSANHVFVLEYDKVEEPFQGSNHHFQFWRHDERGKPRTLAIPQPNPNEQEYYNQIEDLARDLAKTLKTLKNPPKNTELREPVIEQRATIYLAEVTDDLQEYRFQVERYLKEYNIQIIPKTLYYFQGNNANEQLRHAIEADLQKSSLFIQLLSNFKPVRPPGMSTPQLQYECAESVFKAQKELSILQWRDPQLKLNQLTVQKELLNSALVMHIEEFKQYIIQRLKKIEEQKLLQEERQQLKGLQPNSQNESTYQFVFINIIPKDKELANEISEFLLERGIGSGFPLLNKVRPAQKRKDLERNLQDCNGVIMLYDNSLQEWALEQIHHYLRIQSRLKRSIKIIALFNKSPSEEVLLNVKLPNMQFFDCKNFKDNSCLQSFISKLQQ
ncbi:MAG: trypsin-like peptidase domain-containing protein [Thiomargarita sp.]|nr:trypsin-like peptidase domain-containing protein [Thiomargarita sp.]